MKKVRLCFKIIFVLGISIFMLAINLNINASTYLSEEYLIELSQKKNLCYHEGLEFNYITEKSYDEFIHLGNYIYEIFDNSEVEGEYTLIVDLEVTTAYGVKKNATLSVEYIIKDSHVAAINYYFNEYQFYHFQITYLGGGDYYEFEGYDISSYYGEYVTAKILSSYYDENLAIFHYEDYYDVEALEGHEFDNTFFVLYYEDKTNNEINIDTLNPMDLDDIVDILGVYNNNQSRIGVYEVIETNYDPNNLDVGMYYAKIVGIDYDDSIYLKTIYIISKIMTNPITTIDISTRYNEAIDSDYIKNRISVDCECDEVNCTSTYFDNPNICGDYQYTISIKTKNEQYFSNNGNIHVYDDIPPTIDGADTVQTDTENRLMYDEILDKYIINDDYSNDGLKIELKELNEEDNHYINNYNLSGIYRFKIIAKDQYENETTKDIKLYVNIAKIDNPPVNSTTQASSTTLTEPESSTPTITTSITTPTTSQTILTSPSTKTRVEPSVSETSTQASLISKTQREEYKIYTTTNNHLSIEDIKNSLLDNDKITKDEYDTISIESDYFENLDTPGTYIISIKHDGGNITSSLIEVKAQEAKVEEPKEDAKTNKIEKKDIIFYSVIGGLVLVVIILFFIMRRKNHEKNN